MALGASLTRFRSSLSDLQARLGRLGMDAQKEGIYAEYNGSDIHVSIAGLNVPVEIKHRVRKL